MSAFSRELRSFITVSQSASIREAAARLNISAPALSRQMKILERSFGANLLLRSTSGIVLTSEGEALREQALQWMESETKTIQKMQKNRNVSDLHLRIGVMECLIHQMVPRFYERLKEEFGQVLLEVSVGSTNELVTKARNLELDLLVAFDIPTLSEVIITDVHDYHLGVAYAPMLELSGEGSISLQEILKWPLCLPGTGLSMHARLIAEILSERVNPEVVMTSNSISAIVQFLRLGKGVSILTWLDVAEDVNKGQLCFRAISNKRLTEKLSTAICRGNTLADKTHTILTLMKESVSEIGH